MWPIEQLYMELGYLTEEEGYVYFLPTFPGATFIPCLTPIGLSMEVSIDRAQLSQNLNKSLDDLDFTKFLQDHALNHRLAVYFPKKALNYPCLNLSPISFSLALTFYLFWPSKYGY